MSASTACLGALYFFSSSYCCALSSSAIMACVCTQSPLLFPTFMKLPLFLSFFMFSLLQRSQDTNLFILFARSYHQISSASTASSKIPQQTSLALLGIGQGARYCSGGGRASPVAPKDLLLSRQASVRSHDSSVAEEGLSSSSTSVCSYRSAAPSYVAARLLSPAEATSNVANPEKHALIGEDLSSSFQTTAVLEPTPSFSSPSRCGFILSENTKDSSSGAFRSQRTLEIPQLKEIPHQHGDEPGRVECACWRTRESPNGESARACREPATHGGLHQSRRARRSVGEIDVTSAAQRTRSSSCLRSAGQGTKQRTPFSSSPFLLVLPSPRRSLSVQSHNGDRHRNRVGYHWGYDKHRLLLPFSKQQVLTNGTPAFLLPRSFFPLSMKMSMTTIPDNHCQPFSRSFHSVRRWGVGENRGQPQPHLVPGDRLSMAASITPMTQPRMVSSESFSRGGEVSKDDHCVSSPFLGMSLSRSASPRPGSTPRNASGRHGLFVEPHCTGVYLGGRDASMKTSFTDWTTRMRRENRLTPSDCSVQTKQLSPPPATRGTGVGSLVMKVYKGKEIRELSTPEIEREILLTRQEIARLELLKRAYSTEFKPHMLKEAKHYLAQLLTIRYERHLGIRPEQDPWQQGPLGPASSRRADGTSSQGVPGNGASSPSSTENDKTASPRTVSEQKPVRAKTSSHIEHCSSAPAQRPTSHQSVEDNKGKKGASKASLRTGSSSGSRAQAKSAGTTRSAKEPPQSPLVSASPESPSSVTEERSQGSSSSRQPRSSSGGRETGGSKAVRDPLREKNHSPSPEKEPKNEPEARREGVLPQGNKVIQGTKGKRGTVRAGGKFGKAAAAGSLLLDEQHREEKVTTARSCVSSSPQGRKAEENSKEKPSKEEPLAVSRVTQNLHSASVAKASPRGTQPEHTRKTRKSTSEVNSSKKALMNGTESATGVKENAAETAQGSSTSTGHTERPDPRALQAVGHLRVAGEEREETQKRRSRGDPNSRQQDAVRGSYGIGAVRGEGGDDHRRGKKENGVDSGANSTQKASANRKQDKSVRVDSTPLGTGEQESSQRPSATAGRSQQQSSTQITRQPASVSSVGDGSSSIAPGKAPESMARKGERVSVVAASDAGDRRDTSVGGRGKRVREGTWRTEAKEPAKASLNGGKEQVTKALSVNKDNTEAVGERNPASAASGQPRAESSTSLSSSSKKVLAHTNQRPAGGGSPLLASVTQSRRSESFRALPASSPSLATWSAPCSFREFVASEFASRNAATAAASRPLTCNEGFLSYAGNASSPLSSRGSEPCSDNKPSPRQPSSSVLSSLGTRNLSAAGSCALRPRHSIPIGRTGVGAPDTSVTRNRREERTEVVSKANWTPRADAANGLHRM